MDILAMLILAFGMSMDAFAASIGKSASLHHLRFREAIRIGLIFGLVGTTTPLIGWGIGLYASQYIIQWDHWITFSLLFILGMCMIAEGVKKKPSEEKKVKRHGFWLLVFTAIATSLDAMTVGVSLAFLQVNIVHTAIAIGCATMIMATLGIMVGRFICPLLGKRAEILGGMALIGIGINILL
ncbi:MAG: manganese efflux pump MntP [Serratia symbiotica]|nr:manganese efflux pump MntP [Serratia symbiotica]